MDLTFISIHDLTREGRILYSSDSIIDVLGYTPDEVVNHSCWEFFPAEELPYAREFHKRGIEMDRAAVLSYCRVKSKTGQWIGCECCFTIVYDVMVVCTSIYRRGLSSQKRAFEAPVIRRLFSSSPRDPRYHMLSHISAKFREPVKEFVHEPRAALFLNRFTRTLTIMYATGGIEDVIGIPAEVMRGRSFYYCIAENCLPDAVKCLENAKGNDSIAYLRFWFRDPRIDDESSTTNTSDDSDEEMTTDASVDQESEGGVNLDEQNGHEGYSENENAIRSSTSADPDAMDEDSNPNSRTSSGDSTHPANTHEAIFGDARHAESSASSTGPLSPQERRSPVGNRNNGPIEIEAVISCASDGLVVCLRRARPMIPQPTHRPTQQTYERGLFAAPWASEPIVPPIEARPQPAYASNFAPALGPRNAHREEAPTARAGGPDQADFMNAIREQAIFAWALAGINGTLEKYATGHPLGESTPPDGLPIWESDDQAPVDGDTAAVSFRRNDSGNDGQFKSTKFAPGTALGGTGSRDIFGDPGYDRRDGYRSASSNNSG